MKRRLGVLAFLVLPALAWTACRALAHEGESHPQEGGGVRTLTGEVVDLACYLSEGEKGRGPAHRACAQKCIASGLPVGIKTAEGLYLVIGGEHQPANGELAVLAAQRVEVEGMVSEQDGMHLLTLKRITVKE